MPNERILLHICCAPCATTAIQRLRDAGYDVHGFFCNPNIHPEKEYYQRLLEVQRLCKEWHVPLEIAEYDRDRWQAEVRGLEAEPEGGERCRVCFRFRLQAVAEKARELEIDIIATTLTLSPRKSPDVVNPIGQRVCAAIAEETDDAVRVRFHEADWKKKDGYKQSLDVSRRMNIYRQHYCGCRYSLREHDERLALKAALSPGGSKPKRERRETRTAADESTTTPGAMPRAATAGDGRAKWELTPLERRQRRDKKAKPWQRE
jgi:predicted adenine nucleotide alpha hydrolase (AANH) superfamily ATPase